MSKKKIFIILAVVLVIVVFIVLIMKKGSGSEIPVQAEKVKKGDVTQIVSASGRIQPEVEVKISANISAEIVGLYVKEGENVKKGDLLVELDQTKYLASVESAQSNKNSAEATLIKAKNDFSRAKDLFNQNLTSRAEMENAEANYNIAQSQLQQAEASLKQAQDDLTKTKLYSPLTGVVSVLNKEVGEIALGSMFQADVIMVVADLSKMEVLAEVDENDVVLVEIGDTTAIEVDAIPDTTFTGIVSEIAHSATTRGLGTQEEVTNFEVKIAIVDTVKKLRPGMSSTVDIKTETHKNVLLVPIQSVTVRTPREINSVTPKNETTKKDKSVKKEEKANNADSEDNKTTEKEELVEVVFVIDEGIAKAVPVKTGIGNDTHIEIESGLKEGQSVVTGSYRVLSKTLKNGDAVKISDRKIPEPSN